MVSTNPYYRMTLKSFKFLIAAVINCDTPTPLPLITGLFPPLRSFPQRPNKEPIFWSINLNNEALWPYLWRIRVPFSSKYDWPKTNFFRRHPVSELRFSSGDDGDTPIGKKLFSSSGWRWCHSELNIRTSRIASYSGMLRSLSEDWPLLAISLESVYRRRRLWLWAKILPEKEVVLKSKKEEDKR